MLMVTGQRPAQRRVQSAVSPELQSLLKLIGLMTTEDIEMAEALVLCRFRMELAADYMDLRSENLRTRLHRLVGRVERNFGLRFARGPQHPTTLFGHDLQNRAKPNDDQDDF